MSLGDLYRKNKLSLAGQLRINRLAPNRLSNQLMPEWKADLQFLRGCWEAGTEERKDGPADVASARLPSPG